LISGKTILIAPIDWGLGHATRCVPLIKELSVNNKIVIGVTPLNTSVFDFYFPEILKVQLPSYNIKYSQSIPLWLKLLLQWPKIRACIHKEKKALVEIISLHQIDFIISDNRFGLNNKNVHCVFMTHQLNIKAPILPSLINVINLRYIHHFNEVWVPDYEEESRRLSGELSEARKIRIPVKYIGPLSALKTFSSENIKHPKFEILILLSGVEPQRSVVEKELLKKFESSTESIVLVRGTVAAHPITLNNITIVDFASGEKLHQLIVNAKTVICRSGYSTLMDLHLLGKKNIILIPTPGQSEQEYLARYWKKKFKTPMLFQNDISEGEFSS